MKRYFWIFVFLLAISPDVFAQNSIALSVDDAPVTTAAPPVIVNGQIMAPLRAISDRLGAAVIYDPASHSITAYRGNRTVDLAVDSNLAFINGETRYLNAPPTVINGRVMVPLQFLVEAYGLEAQWSADTDSLNIVSLTGGPDVTGTTPQIKSVETAANGLLGTGDRLRVELIGDPDGTASFDIDNVTSGVPMRETSPGHYVGVYPIPPGLEVHDGKIIGHLSVSGRESLMAAPETVNILGRLSADTGIQLNPQPETVVRFAKPLVSAYFTDQIIPGTVHVLIDNNDVTSSSEIDNHAVQWMSKDDLEPGRHQVTISGENREGSTFTKTWTFYLSP